MSRKKKMTNMSKNKVNNKSVELESFFNEKEDKEKYEKKKRTADTMMRISAGPYRDGRTIKYDYIGVARRGLFGEVNKSEKDKEKEALDRIAEHNRGVCWDYARCKKLLLSEDIPLACWICSYQRKKGITHTFLVVDGYAKLNDIKMWEPIGTDKQLLLKAFQKKDVTPITKSIVMVDPFYSQNVWFPDAAEMENRRESPNIKKWYVMESSDFKENSPEFVPKCCAWKNFAKKTKVDPGKNKIYVLKSGFQDHFVEDNWTFYS